MFLFYFRHLFHYAYVFISICFHFISDIYFIMHMFPFYFRYLFHYAYVSILFQIFISLCIFHFVSILFQTFISLCICFHFISDIYFIMHMFPFYFRHLFHYAYVSILFQTFISLCICFHFISDIYFNVKQIFTSVIRVYDQGRIQDLLLGGVSRRRVWGPVPRG